MGTPKYGYIIALYYAFSNDNVKGNESGKERAAPWYTPRESLG